MLQAIQSGLTKFGQLFHNPMVFIGDASHLHGNRWIFKRPYTDRYTLGSYIAKHPHVLRAMKGMGGEYLLNVAIIEGEVRVNLHAIQPRITARATEGLFEPMWKTLGIMQYMTRLSSEHGTFDSLDGVHIGFVDPVQPEWSWTLPLPEDLAFELGLKVLD